MSQAEISIYETNALEKWPTMTEDTKLVINQRYRLMVQQMRAVPLFVWEAEILLEYVQEAHIKHHNQIYTEI